MAELRSINCPKCAAPIPVSHDKLVCPYCGSWLVQEEGPVSAPVLPIPILKVMVEFFNQDQWPFQWVDGKTTLQTCYKGKSGAWDCYAKERVGEDRFLFYSYCPNYAPGARRMAISEFITRANYGLVVGNFEMDFNDGEIRFKTSLDVEDAALTAGLLHHLVYANVLSMDRYLPGLLKVIFNFTAPEKAIAEIEKS